MAIWQDLVSESGFDGGYQTVKRFVRKLRGNQFAKAWATKLSLLRFQVEEVTLWLRQSFERELLQLGDLHSLGNAKISGTPLRSKLRKTTHAAGKLAVGKARGRKGQPHAAELVI